MVVKRAKDRITGWSHSQSIWALRISIAIVFIWFGLLKVLGLSPAEELVLATLEKMPIPFLSVAAAYKLLAFWEVAIGVCIVVPQLLSIGLLLLFAQMAGTFAPLILLPDRCFGCSGSTWAPALTMEGQYIIKNVVLVSAGLVLLGTLHRAESK